MKKAIFLVDDIVDGKVVTLLERVYEKLIAKLVTEGYQFGWISETPRTLYNCSSDFITFRKASEFIAEVKNTGTIDKNVDVFYFISAWLHVKTFHLTDFFAVDPDVTDFLVENKIPIIVRNIYTGEETVYAEGWTHSIFYEKYKITKETLNKKFLNKQLNEKQFKDTVRQWNNYSTDYKPLLLFMREIQLNGIATNVPRRFANLLFKKGEKAMDTLSLEDKSNMVPLPFTIDSTLTQYAALKEMEQH